MKDRDEQMIIWAVSYAIENDYANQTMTRFLEEHAEQLSDSCLHALRSMLMDKDIGQFINGILESRDERVISETDNERMFI